MPFPEDTLQIIVILYNEALLILTEEVLTQTVTIQILLILEIDILLDDLIPILTITRTTIPIEEILHQITVVQVPHLRQEEVHLVLAQRLLTLQALHLDLHLLEVQQGHLLLDQALEEIKIPV